jgi:hypothetical protein
MLVRTVTRFLEVLGEENPGLTPVLQNHLGTAFSTPEDYKEVFTGIGDDPRIRKRRRAMPVASEALCTAISKEW